MGITVEQWRAAIGGFSRRTCVSRDSHNEEETNPNPDPSQSSGLTWKWVTLGLLLVLVSHLCHAQLLLMGGIEPHPGPPKSSTDKDATQPNAGAWATSPDGLKAQQETLDKLIALSQDSIVQNVLRKYQPTKTVKAITKDFSSVIKENLVSAMTFLGMPNQEKFTKPIVIANLITRIQNLLPDKCSHCDTPYCIEIQETPLITCCMCGQGAHTPCFASLINIDQKDIAALTSDDVMRIVNPLNIPTMHYLCEACSADVIPQPAASSKPASQAPKSQPTNQDGDAAAGSDASHAADEAEIIDVDLPDPMATQNNQQPQRRHRKSGDSRSKEAIKPEDICPHFIKGTCRFGRAGSECPKSHPRLCRKFLAHGERAGKGCTYGARCKFYHLPVCQASQQKGECLDDKCGKRHIGGTRRTNSRPICPTSQQKLECFNSECKLHHLKGTKRLPPTSGRANSTTKKSDFLDVAHLMSTLKTEMMSAMMGAIDSKFSSMQTATSHAQTSAATSRPAQTWLQAAQTGLQQQMQPPPPPPAPLPPPLTQQQQQPQSQQQQLQPLSQQQQQVLSQLLSQLSQQAAR